MKKRYINIAYIFLSALTLVSANLMAQEDKVWVLKTEAKWKFSIGDSMRWAQTTFDDSDWDLLKVPGAWEDQGFYNYDGFGWYRTSIVIGKEFKNHDLFLSLGYIDDVEQVYFNGNLIGFSGKFPPEYSTGLEAKRKYAIPEQYINFQGKNTIAVRIYNLQLAGGIISGDQGVFYYKNPKPDISLNGLWQFRTGDSKLWKSQTYKDNSWKRISVPGNWENQGFKGYKGDAWYLKSFLLPEEAETGKYILVLGAIPDNCQVYINNTELQSVGKASTIKIPDDLKRFRVFAVPENALALGKKNTLAIRFDSSDSISGIQKGPIGLFKTSD